MSADKVLSSFFLFKFEIVSGKAQPGSPGIVMESRKAAPALRARLLRSYVPLRRDPNERELSGTIPGLPGGSYPLHKLHLFINSIDYDFEHGVFPAQFFVAVIFGEGDVDFYSVTRMCANELFFKVIDVQS